MPMICPYLQQARGLHARQGNFMPSWNGASGDEGHWAVDQDCSGLDRPFDERDIIVVAQSEGDVVELLLGHTGLKSA